MLVLVGALGAALSPGVRAAQCGDGTACELEWDVGVGYSPVDGLLNSASSDPVICVSHDGSPMPSVTPFNTGKTSLTFCGAEGTSAPIPALAIRFAGDPATVTLQDITLSADGLTESRGGIQLSGNLTSLELEDVLVQDGVYAVGLVDITASSRPEVRFKGVQVDTASTSLMKTTDDVDVVFEDGEDGAPPVSYGALRTATLLLAGEDQPSISLRTESAAGRESSLRRDLDSAGAVGPLTSSDSLFRSVELSQLVVEGYDCASCVAASSVRAASVEWRLEASAGVPEPPKGVLFTADSVSIDGFVFRTDGDPWTLAKGGSINVLGLDFCAADGSGDDLDPVFQLGAGEGSSLRLWNSSVVMAQAITPLAWGGPAFPPEIYLRGTTVVTPIDTTDETQLSLVQDSATFGALNSLVVGAYLPPTAVLPAGWSGPAHVVLAAASEVFVDAASVRSCDVLAIPDGAATGTRGKGVQTFTDPDGETELLWVLAGNELQDFPSVGAADDTWCDPDGTWPDVGAWSGPLSLQTFDPELGSGRPCEPDGTDTADPTGDSGASDSGGAPSDSGGSGSEDSGEVDHGETDSGGGAGSSASAYSWGGTCGDGGAAAVALLPVLGLWWRRRRRRVHA